MKRNILVKLTLGVSLLTMIGYSCKDTFLEVLPTGSIAKSQLTSKNGLEGALIAAYGQMSGYGTRMVHPNNWVWGSIRGGDANKGTDPGDFSDINPIQRFEYLSTQGVINDNYRGLYEGVARANSVLALLPDAQSDITADDKKRIEAEAKFLRAHFYFSLKRNYNNTPYVDETVDVGSGIELVKNDADLYPKIEADFKFAYDNLAATQSQVGRANKWAAASYLAKVYMAQKKYADAKTLFDAIIANGVTTGGKKYALVESFPDLYKASNDNNSESIFAVQAAANTGSVNNANGELDLNWPYNTGPNGPGNCCGFFQPSFELGNSFRTKDGLPLLDGSYNTPANALKTDMGIQSSAAFTLDAGELDPRLDHTIGRRGIQFLDWIKHPGFDWIRNQANGGPYSPKKYSYYKSDVGKYQDNSSWTPGYTALNVTVMRFADILLMAAECEVEVGSLEKAREYVNMIRTRAAKTVVMNDGAPAANYKIKNYESPWTDKTVARAAVRFERKLELAMEGHRFFDLVRWGSDVTDINNYLKYESQFLPNTLGGSTYQAKHALLPLPQGQIDLVGADVLKQNPGY
ncbi:RagB/SusD family nutrient uptake outer membrane protein [Lacihabitans sp. LS3-19]|uniref:RagB/SusD family nutrient uptake outer membrane protein n=1 Tax=Lacihabitans sp. LS3-19 TaxID=2487335 RepID=UPI0020CF75A5|nr:RagB/SusD family nutrient uptake outer membrane protein [Lacihabitans sp. LS3-19]MCP9770090.1 RagB/SusD family nutrient uptake outer membrane protein [Lacihabitans sp. LS3-19]